MSDETFKYDAHTMKLDQKKTEEKSTEEENKIEADVEETKDDASDDDQSQDEESSGDESEDEDKSSSKKKEELDLDAEIEKERKAGKPDPEIAEKAFKDRKNKKQEDTDDDGDKPLTQKDLDAHDAKIRKEMQQERALEIAKEMAGSEKEAELIVAKWGNRTFPTNLSLKEQITEMYGAVYAKKLIGERNEALRGLKGKQGVKKDPAPSHHDGTQSGIEPKLPPSEMAVLKQSGFVWNVKTRRYEKKTANGRTLVRDPKTKQVTPLPVGSN